MMKTKNTNLTEFLITVTVLGFYAVMLILAFKNL